MEVRRPLLLIAVLSAWANPPAASRSIVRSAGPRMMSRASAIQARRSPPVRGFAIREGVQDDIDQLKRQIQEQAEKDATPQVRDPLPPQTKAEIFRACFLVSGLIGSTGVALRKYAGAKLKVSGADAETIRAFTSLEIPDLLHIEPKDVAVMVGVGLAVTALRQLTLKVWEDYQWATDRSNEQVLRPLSMLDLAWVALLPGISEELLFRGALIPAVFPDWRGALIGALTFGVLHNSGGRNLASASFATVAGAAYGASFLATQSLLVPMGAHSLSNFLSAFLWLQSHPEPTLYKPKERKSDVEDDSESSSSSAKEEKPKPVSLKKKIKSQSNKPSSGGFGSS
uniref:CAAX prenyl protease 2/Lysostaphin resistance protein A-like domain-containing protein n=1 Tax=Lotharella oceanica TaxID=641309 RepID=A0A7S2TRE5_9EUKA|mmetsp:Transcript_25910/g.48316  ORF Transcript_25910/g.48316 Transcript_25910/m.48316 type:complete len:341 (+) Transcript_25910:15-1037(+)